MRVSWKWLSELVDLTQVGGPTGLADLLTRRGLEVEEVRPLAKGMEKVVTVQILKRDPHPQADRLSLCSVSLGEGAPLEIVCGAQNMKAGDKVALAQIGAQLPNGLKIAQSKIRGVVSNGMLCSEEELGLKDSSEGILILPQETPLGRPLAEILGLDDTILTLKLTANRGDCLSHFGLAREIAAALGQKPKKPKSQSLALEGSPVSLHLDAGEAGPQFWGCAIEGIQVGPSPAWLVKRLEAVGSRSINNVVDATNYVMLELGHPLHAYDADRIEGNELHIRMAKDGEQLPLLDGQSVTLNGTELVIADRGRAVGLAGVMGGGNSEVQDGTKRIFVECAEFDARLVRRAASRHTRHTDAAHRFERGVDPAGLQDALARVVGLILELAGGKVRGATAQRLPSRNPVAKRSVTLRSTFINEFLGTELPLDQIEGVLKSLDCQVERQGDAWKVTPPTYRLDLVIPEDLAEEIARSVGYDRIPATLPALSSQPLPLAADAAAARNIQLDRIKDALVRLGMAETVNFSFTSRTWLEQFGMESTARVLNPLSEEHEALVPSLLPGLIKNALDNNRHHFGSEPLAIRLFEVRPTFQSSGAITAPSEMETTVQERWKVSMVLSGPRFAEGLRLEQGEVDFYDLKAQVQGVLEALGTRGARLNPMSQSRSQGTPLFSLFHPGQSAELLAGNTVAGYFGLLHPGIAKNFKLRAPLWIAELDLEALLKLSRGASEVRTFKAWPQFPPMERDFALLVKGDVTADKITQVAIKSGKPLAKLAKVFDVYRGSQVAEGMTSVAVRVIFFEEGRSLQEAETEAVSQQILEAWKKELGAQLRG